MKILVDYNQVCIAGAYFIKKKHPEVPVDIKLVRNVFLWGVLSVCKVYSKQSISEIVTCFDTPPYWRTSLFPYYKFGRNKRVDDKIINHAQLKAAMKEHREELEALNIFNPLGVEHLEADDIIAVLSKATKSKVVIVSSDGDFKQLLSDRVVQYNPRTKLEVVCDTTPHDFLLEKVLKGDRGDGVPNVLSDDDTFATPDKRQVPLTKNKIAQMKAVILESCPSDDIRKNFNRNYNLMALVSIPKTIETSVISQYNRIKEKKTGNLFEHLMQKAPHLVDDANFFNMTPEKTTITG